MSHNVSIYAQDEDRGQRVDKFFVAHSDLTRSRIKALINAGHLTIDDKPADNAAAKIQPGVEYTLSIPAPVAAVPTPEDIPLDIVFEDEHLIVVNKPVGMTVHPAVGNWSGTLVNALLYHCGDSLSGIGGVTRPGIVHRIDKDTSGLLVVAKHDKAHVGLSNQFSKHTVERTYICFTRGAPMPREGRIETNIGRSSSDRKKMAVYQEKPRHLLRYPDEDPAPKIGKHAITNYKFLKGYGQQKGASIGAPLVSKIQCNLETGRTHQIRVHMAHMMCPLLGDQTYGKTGAFKTANSQSELKLRAALSTFKRQALHAKSLGFIHPITKAHMTFDSQLPKDIAILEANLDEL